MIRLSNVKMKTKLVCAFSIAVAILLVAIVILRTGKVKDLPTVSAPDLSNHPIYSNYDFGEDNVIGFGIQPLVVPVGVLSEVMRRDAVLRKALSEQGLEIQFYPFLKGADANFFLKRGDLEVAMGGDMSVLTACATSGVLVATLTKQGFSSIVAQRHMLMKELRGKRIGYAFGSNAHYALLQSLTNAGLQETDVRLVPLDINEMPEALDKGKIDAFSGWEPATSIALAKYDDFVVIHRSLSSSYLYFSRSFVEQHPTAVRHIVASQLRSMAWMRHRKENLLNACRWTMQAGDNLSGQTPVFLEEQCASLVKSTLLDISSVAAIPEKYLAPDGQLFREYEFLKGLGKIPGTADWEEVRSCFDLTIIEEVLSGAQKYQLDTHDYSYEGGENHAPR